MFNSLIKKTVVDKPTGERVLLREFTTFTQPVEDVEGSIESFFEEYERLFFEIPVSGDTQSHEFIVRRSSEYSGFEKDTEEIDSLLEEIEALREQNLELEQTIIDLEIQLEGKVGISTFEKQAQLLTELDV